jgi:tRNA U34 5-carboxymethylaminomethyl modifying GTPase MnmE/TrmE
VLWTQDLDAPHDLHPRHRRPAQRGQVDPVQPPGRQALALVDDQPGVTRDLREGEARLGPLRFTVIDTAGLEEATDDSLQGRMRKLTERAVEMADACLFVIDARAGVLPATRSSPTSCAARPR